MQKLGFTLARAQKETLQRKIRMEDARRQGDWLGVLSEGGSVVDRFRALSVTNATMYSIRRRLYGLLSGW